MGSSLIHAVRGRQDREVDVHTSSCAALPRLGPCPHAAIIKERVQPIIKLSEVVVQDVAMDTS